MKRIAFVVMMVVVFAACNNQAKKKDSGKAEKATATVLTVDELYEKAASLTGKEVVVKGTVMHVCKEAGARCFIMGSGEDIILRVEAGEGIGAFTQEQMGSELEITGVLTQVTTEAEAHNPAKEHGHGDEGEEDGDAHETISAAEDAQEISYYLKGVKAKEVLTDGQDTEDAPKG